MKRPIHHRACTLVLGAALSLLSLPVFAQADAFDVFGSSAPQVNHSANEGDAPPAILALPPDISFSRVSHSANEGDTMTFVVKKSGDGEASVDYTTFSAGVDNQATANVDYVATSGTLTFYVTDTQHTITVKTNADTEIGEASETFGVKLSLTTGGDGGQSSATLVYPASAVGTILNCATPC